MPETNLVADVGGTHARFALADARTGALAGERTLRTADHASLADAARAFLAAAGARPKAACFAVAAPVDGAEIDFTNSDWVLRPEEMRTALGLARVVAINDFHALALAVDRLAEADFAPVKSGAPVADAPVLVLGPGTGFGQALIVPCGDRRRIVTTEGGHVGFAPHTEDEIAVMRVIAGAHGRASVERLLSGAGLANVHRALRAISKSPTGDLAPEDVTAAARAGADPIATQALAMFCAVLGAVAGDAVLATGARGGVVLGGGILPRIRDILSQSAFTERFLAKGRMRGYVENVPARLILRDGAALLGAAAALAGAAPD